MGLSQSLSHSQRMSPPLKTYLSWGCFRKCWRLLSRRKMITLSMLSSPFCTPRCINIPEHFTHQIKSYTMDADSGYICTVTQTHHKTVKSLNVLLEIRAYVILKCQYNRGAGNFRQGMAVSFPSHRKQASLIYFWNGKYASLSIHIFSMVINLAWETVRLLALSLPSQIKHWVCRHEKKRKSEADS